MSAKAGPPSENDKMDLRYREEVLLDENEEARGHSYFDLGAFKARNCSCEAAPCEAAVSKPGPEAHALASWRAAEGSRSTAPWRMHRLLRATHEAAAALLLWRNATPAACRGTGYQRTLCGALAPAGSIPEQG